MELNHQCHRLIVLFGCGIEGASNAAILGGGEVLEEAKLLLHMHVVYVLFVQLTHLCTHLIVK